MSNEAWLIISIRLLHRARAKRTREREREGTRDPANPRNRGAKITAEGLSSQCPARDKDSRRVCENFFPINNTRGARD